MFDLSEPGNKGQSSPPRARPSSAGFAPEATGGADETIDLAAPPTGLQAQIVAQLTDDCARKSSDPGASITEAEGAQLNDTVRALGGVFNATHGRMVLAMCRVLESGWWDGGGIVSAKQWLSMHWSTTSANVGRVIAVAKQANAYPEVVEALVAGEITLEAAQLICRRVPTEFQTDFVGYARNMTMSQLRACTPSVPAPTGDEPTPETGSNTGDDEQATGPNDDPSGNEPTVGNPPNRVSFGAHGDGRWSLNANLSAEDGALFETALQQVRDLAFNAAEDPDEQLRLSWSDALVGLARRSLDHADADTADGRPTDRTLVHFHYQLGRLYADGSDQPLPHAIARQILCDTNLVAIGFKDGRPVDVGRKSRTIPDRLRRIVIRRDGGCVVPGCGAGRGLEIHHRIHWEDGGPTDASNLVAICKAHHRAHHHGLLHIHGDPYSGLSFTNANHQPICARPPITPTTTEPHDLTSQALDCGMTDPAEHRLGPVGGRLQRWAIIPGPKPVPPRPPDLGPISPSPGDANPGDQPTPVRRE
ncbi:MAG: DUF222 domain-containing protein [Microthrixaceae bacterium]